MWNLIIPQTVQYSLFDSSIHLGSNCGLYLFHCPNLDKRKFYRFAEQLRGAGCLSQITLGPWNSSMFYVYVLVSKKDNGFYIGCTSDLRIRIRVHNAGYVKSTKNRLPLELVYYEACLNQSDAFCREKYLKSTYGRRYLKNRLKVYFTG